MPVRSLHLLAERFRLAQVLSTPVDDLGFLERLGTEELRGLRLACTRFLQQRHRPLFQRVATASKLLPTSVVAAIAEHRLGPLLAARIAGEMSVPRALAVCRHLSPEFMAAVTVQMETGLVSELAAALPLCSVRAIARVLMDRQEFITLGDLVQAMPREIIQAVLQEARDGEVILRTALFIEQPLQLQQILELMPAEQLQGVLQAVADSRLELWPHALALMTQVSPYWQRRLVKAVMGSGMGVLDSMLRGAVRHGLWPTALPLLELLTPDDRRQLLELAAWDDEAALRSFLEAAVEPELWPLASPLFPLMPADLRRRADHVLAELGHGGRL